MTNLGAIPPEVVEHIVILADPLDLAAFSRTSSLYHSIINPPNHQRLWRTVYLAQSLDDPRTCRNLLGNPTFPSSESNFDWRAALQRIMRTRKVIQTPGLWSEDRIQTLQTLLYLITNIPSTTSLTDSISLNLAWVAALLQNSAYLDTKLVGYGPEEAEEDQLRARIHCCFGLTKLDIGQASLTRSRAYVYDMRNYRGETDFGPLMLEEDHDEEINDLVDPFQIPIPVPPRKLVNWVHVQAIHHVVSMHIVEERLDELVWRHEKGKFREGEDELKDFGFIHYPMSLPYCQSVIPEGFELDAELDWAGVEGLWKCYFCYFDHRELMLFNRYRISSDMEPLDASIFERSYFREVLHTLTVDIHITEAEADPLHPTRPKLHFAGNDPATLPFAGWVAYTPDDQIQWYFEYGENGQMTWSSSGIQVGAVRSPFGVIGGWTAVNHSSLSPVGPFWFHKVNDAIVQRLDEVENDNEGID